METNEEKPTGNSVNTLEGDDPLLYAESLKDIFKSPERLNQFKDECYSQFTPSQKEVFDEVVNAVKKGLGGCFFVEARRGRMKLDLLNSILAAVLVEEDESSSSPAAGGTSTLATSSLQLTSHLLLGGRTFHYMFNASLVTKDLNLQITKGSIPAEMIRRAKVIVVDEAVYLNKSHIENLDQKLREIASPDQIFGGKVIVLAGDFRQLLPVGDGDRLQLVINRSSLWSEFKVFTLRAREEVSSDGELDTFGQWLQKLGNGDLPFAIGDDRIELPEDLCMELQVQKRNESLRALIQFVFPSFNKNIHDCAILATKNVYVREINNACMESMPGKIEPFLSNDSNSKCTCSPSSSDTCPCSVEIPGLPLHRLELQMGVPLILLATVQTEERVTGTPLTLSTGTRLTLEEILDEYLQCTVAGGGGVVHIPIMPLRPVPSVDAQWDDIERRQFPVQVGFATTIHKSQGLMLKRVGVWLEEDVFTHGQLYTAASCVRRREDIRFVLHKRDRPPYYVTRNIVFKKVFEASYPRTKTQRTPVVLSW